MSDKLFSFLIVIGGTIYAIVNKTLMPELRAMKLKLIAVLDK